MCGIAFLFDASLLPEMRVQRMRACLEVQRHRGPDDGRIESLPNAVVGHRRLSIIDLAGSIQPMWCAAKRYVLSFNGEIYNYRELRASLASRWQFRTDGDTEVLLAGLLLEGSVFINRMEGMWAFAVYDTVEGCLLAARDRMGKKPLYYLTGSDYFACASELPALRKLSDRPWHEDEDSTADYLRYGYPMPGYTAYREVREVLPGHLLRWSPGDASPNQEAYWQLRIDRFSGDQRQAGVMLRQVMIEAVRRRLVADVEVGAFLSGGVDSSLICSIVRQELGQPLKTFTIGFKDAAFDERRYARQAADAFGTDHYEAMLDEWDESVLERLARDHVGQPFADASLLPTLLVSEIASRHLKVVLSGDGGDEVFSGYQRYQARVLWRWYVRLPATLRKIAAEAVRVLPEPMAHHSRSLLKKAHLFLDTVDRQESEWPYFAPMMFSRNVMEDLAPDLVLKGHRPPLLPDETNLDDVQRMMFADALIYLPQDILVKVDRASMACSVESRAPFLDRAVVEFAFSLPRTWHRRGMAGKRMLRKAMGDLLPAALWQRRKQGFGVPVHAWFQKELGDRLQEFVNELNTPLTSSAVNELLVEHRQQRKDHGNRLWALYSYLLWKKGQQL